MTTGRQVHRWVTYPLIACKIPSPRTSFMLWGPFQIMRLKNAKGHIFSIAFTIAAAVPAGLAFIPASRDLAGIQAYGVGFILWALSIVAASAWFSWIAWRNSLSLLPNVILAATLLFRFCVWLPFVKGQ